MPRFPAGLLTAFLVIPVTLAAQNPPASVPDTGNVTLLDVTVHPGEYEPHTLFLQKGIVYRISFSGPNIQIKMRSYQHKQLPFVVELTNDVDATGGSEYELYPQSDGDIEFSAVDVGGTVPVTFRLWKDARSTERGRRSADEGYWELGVDALVGWQGRYSAIADGAGMTLGGCLSVRNGPGPLGWINGCIVGAEGLTGPRGGFRFFSEPEIRLSNGRRTDTGWKNEWGLLVRINIIVDGGDGANLLAGRFGYGAYLARDLRDLNGSGWRITLAARAESGDKITTDGLGFTTGQTRVWAPAFQLGIGRYH